jgi:hypothetical protein
VAKMKCDTLEMPQLRWAGSVVLKLACQVSTPKLKAVALDDVETNLADDSPKSIIESFSSETERQSAGNNGWGFRSDGRVQDCRERTCVPMTVYLLYFQ